jgi:hypothetical protein
VPPVGDWDGSALVPIALKGGDIVASRVGIGASARWAPAFAGATMRAASRYTPLNQL